MNYFLGFGINNYPGFQNDLTGCINDVKRMQSKIRQLDIGFDISTMFDNEVVKDALEAEIRIIYDTHRQVYKDGDSNKYLFVYYSGHGTRITGTNGYYEALYLYDKPFPDYELRELFSECPKGLIIIFGLDSCFSGGMFRALLNKIPFGRRTKFLKSDNIIWNIPEKKSFFKTGADNVLIFSGCAKDQYSYENSEGGVFTTALLTVINLAKSYIQTIFEVNENIDKSKYPQDPELLGDNDTLKSQLLFNDEIGDIIPDPQPMPEEENNHGWWIIGGVVILIIIILLVFGK